MNSKHLPLGAFVLTLFYTLCITSCSEEEELAQLIGSWEVHTVNVSADFDEELFVASLIEQGLSEGESNELLTEFRENLVEVSDLDQVTIIHEFIDENTYVIRNDFINDDYPDYEQNGTYTFNRETREMVFSPIDDPISNDPIIYTVETFTENDLVLAGNSELVSTFGRDAITLEVPLIVTTSISMTRL